MSKEHAEAAYRLYEQMQTIMANYRGMPECDERMSAAIAALSAHDLTAPNRAYIAKAEAKLAALSALPAAGGAKPRPVAWYVFAGTEHWVTHDEDEAEGNRAGGCEVRPLIFGDTTPQPSAAEWEVVRGVDAERREDMSPRGRLRLHAAEDGDMHIMVVEDDGTSAGVEFCASGGHSPQTLEALRYLSRAMQADNEGRAATPPPDAAVGAQGDGAKIADEIMRLVQHGATVDWRPNMAEIAGRVRALATTPQPSAAECPACKGVRYVMRVSGQATCWRCDGKGTIPADAAVGAQGEAASLILRLTQDADTLEADGDEHGVCQTLDDAAAFLRRLAAPAAGKGEDDLLDLATLYGDHSFDSRNRESWDFDAHGLKQLAAALTRQPVAGDGMVLVPKEPTPAMLSPLVRRSFQDHWEAGKRLQSEQLQRSSAAGNYGYQDWMIPPKTEYEVAAGQYLAMLAAAPAAMPTGGKAGG